MSVFAVSIFVLARDPTFAYAILYMNMKIVYSI